MSCTMRAMDGERFLLLPKPFFFHHPHPIEIHYRVQVVKKKSFRNGGEQLVPDPGRDARCSHARRLLQEVLFRLTGLAFCVF